MRTAIVLAILLATPVAAPAVPAEEREANNAVFFEALGRGVLYSFNYERFIGDFAIRVGAGAVPFLFSVPLSASYLGIRSGSHCLDLGAGGVFAVSPFGSDPHFPFGSGAVGVAGTAIVGYRYAALSKGLMLRVAFTPLFGSGKFTAWGGVAFGGVF